MSQEIAPGNYDRAWNDPPQLSFNIQNGFHSGSSNRLRAMQKRMPISLPEPSGQAPKDINGDANAEKITPKSEEKPGIPAENKVETLENVESALLKSLSCFENVIEEKIIEDINKRIAIMKGLWTEGKLHPQVQSGMKSLAAALNNKDYDTAWSFHQSLMVNYTSNCLSWMVGIKTLISTGRNLPK